MINIVNQRIFYLELDVSYASQHTFSKVTVTIFENYIHGPCKKAAFLQIYNCKEAAFLCKNAALLQLYMYNRKRAAFLCKNAALFYNYIIVKKLLSYVKMLHFYNYVFVKKLLLNINICV